MAGAIVAFAFATWSISTRFREVPSAQARRAVRDPRFFVTAVGNRAGRVPVLLAQGLCTDRAALSRTPTAYQYFPSPLTTFHGRNARRSPVIQWFPERAVASLTMGVAASCWRTLTWDGRWPMGEHLPRAEAS